MAAIKFELKQEHLDLLKQLSWSQEDDTWVLRSTSKNDSNKLYEEDELMDAVSLIVDGKYMSEDPLNQDEINKYDSNTLVKYHNLLLELPTALDVILYTQSFELGFYKTRSYLRKWEKIKL